MSNLCDRSCPVFQATRGECQNRQCPTVGLNCLSYGAPNSTTDCYAWCCVRDDNIVAVVSIVVAVVVVAVVACVVFIFCYCCRKKKERRQRSSQLNRENLVQKQIELDMEPSIQSGFKGHEELSADSQDSDADLPKKNDHFELPDRGARGPPANAYQPSLSLVDSANDDVQVPTSSRLETVGQSAQPIAQPVTTRVGIQRKESITGPPLPAPPALDALNNYSPKGVPAEQRGFGEANLRGPSPYQSEGSQEENENENRSKDSESVDDAGFPYEEEFYDHPTDNRQTLQAPLSGSGRFHGAPVLDEHVGASDYGHYGTGFDEDEDFFS